MIDLKIKLPENFLEEEMRCGYRVTSLIKKVWAVELDLYAELDRVCKKYNIKFCAAGRTLVGAISHKGFIPWDDDLDIAMLRDDYEKLCKVAPKEFKSPYFFQTEQTDPGSARGHAQLRNSRTTAILKSEIDELNKNTYNQGIFIDIFPFDSVPENENEQRKLYDVIVKKNKKYHSIIRNKNYFNYTFSKNAEGKIDIIMTIKRYLRHLEYLITKADYAIAYNEFEELCKKYNDYSETLMVADFCIPVGLDRIQRYRKDFDNLVLADFEFLKIPVFKDYDRNLRNLYGDKYMKPQQVASEHNGVFFDPEKSYTYYKERYRNFIL